MPPVFVAIGWNCMFLTRECIIFETETYSTQTNFISGTVSHIQVPSKSLVGENTDPVLRTSSCQVDVSESYFPRTKMLCSLLDRKEAAKLPRRPFGWCKRHREFCHKSHPLHIWES
jgi:hypothetical protein